MSKPLREGINEFVIDYVQAKTATGEAIDAAEIAYEMAQSLIDIIMKEEAERQASLFALVLADSAKNTSFGAVYWMLGTKLPIRLPSGSEPKSVGFFARQVVPTLVRSEQEFADL